MAAKGLAGAFACTTVVGNEVGTRRGTCYCPAMPEKPLAQIPPGVRELYEKGVAAVQKNNLDYAITLLTSVLRQEPAFYEAREALRATQHKKSSGSRSFFKKLVGSASSLTRGKLALRSNPAEALNVAEEALNEDPTNLDAHELLAEAAMALGLPKTALLSLEVAFKARPTHRKLALHLAQALAQQGNRARAEKIYRDLLAGTPNDPEIQQLLKNVLAERTMKEGGYAGLEGGEGSYRDILKNKEEAQVLEQENRTVKDVDVAARLISEYEAKLARDPQQIRFMRELADLHFKRNEFTQCRAYLERILSTGGVNDPMILELLRNTRLAEFAKTEGELDPTAADYSTQLADLRQARFTWQLEDARRRAEQNPTDLGIKYELGSLYLEAGRLSEAIPELQRAQNNPNRRISAMNLLAQAFARRGMNDLAAKKLQEAIREKPIFDDEAKELRYQLGVVLEKIGKSEEAIEQFKIIYEQDVAYRDVTARVDAYYGTQG